MSTNSNLSVCHFGAFKAPSDEGAVSEADWGREKYICFIKMLSKS